MNRGWRWLCVAVLGAISALGCASQQGTGPKAVVEEYCKLDFDGARLSASAPGYQRIYTLVSWETEPGWDQNLLVSSFVVGGGVTTGRRVLVPVTYEVVARSAGDDPIQIAKTEERADFVLVYRGSAWVIDEGQIPPHVSVPAEIKHLESLVRDEADPARRDVLVRDIGRLRAMR